MRIISILTNNESDGRNRSGNSRIGERALSSDLTQAAKAAAHTITLFPRFHPHCGRRWKNVPSLA